MEQYLNLISVPAIAAVVYWVINIIKHAVGENEKFKRCIPLITTESCVALFVFTLCRVSSPHRISWWQSSSAGRVD